MDISGGRTELQCSSNPSHLPILLSSFAPRVASKSLGAKSGLIIVLTISEPVFVFSLSVLLRKKILNLDHLYGGYGVQDQGNRRSQPSIGFQDGNLIL